MELTGKLRSSTKIHPGFTKLLLPEDFFVSKVQKHSHWGRTTNMSYLLEVV